MRALIFILLACLCSAASAEIYTWRDASGKVHYSDKPPAGLDARTVRGAPAAGPSAEGASRSLAEREMDFRKRRDEAAKAQAKAETDKREAEESRRNCEQAKRQLQALESGQRMSRINAAGERVPLDDAMRAQEIESTRRSVESWCK